MEMNLKEALKTYKSITVKLIEALENEDYDALEALLSQRQFQIDQMNKIQYSKDEFSAICAEFDILRLQEKLNGKMNEKRVMARNELDKINDAKAANRGYNKRYNVDSIYFNKKI